MPGEEPQMQQSNAELWREKTELFALISRTQPALQPMCDFIEWLASSAHSKLLMPTTSHLVLMLEAPAYRAQARHRVIVEYNHDDTFSIRYRAINGDEMAPNYAIDEIRIAIEAWMKRLEMEAQIRNK